MSYSVVLGDLGPVFPITLTDDGAPFVLDPNHHIAKLRYVDPAGTAHEVDLAIANPAAGTLQRTWISGDLPVPGYYMGLVKLTRDDADLTYPRSFPNNGAKIIWLVADTI